MNGVQGHSRRKYCYGKTLIQVFRDSNHVALRKVNKKWVCLAIIPDKREYTYKSKGCNEGVRLNAD